MSERLLGKRLDTFVKIISFGKFGVEVTSSYRAFEEQLRGEERNLATRLYDLGTLVVIDSERGRIFTRYRIFKRQDKDDWNTKGQRTFGDTSFEETTGKSLEKILFPDEHE